MIKPMQRGDSFDFDCIGAGARDFRTHSNQTYRQVQNFWFLSCISQGSDTIGQSCSQHEVFCSSDRYKIENNLCANQPIGGYGQIPLFNFYTGTHRLEPLDMLVDRPLSYCASARQGNSSFTITSHQRAQNQHRSPHRSYQLIRCLQAI